MKNINYVKHETSFYNHLWQKIRTTLLNERHNWKDFFYIISDATASQGNRLWEKQILHVWVQNEDTANIVSKVANQLLNDHYSTTSVVISKAEGSDFIFTNDIKMSTQSPRHGESPKKASKRDATCHQRA